MRPVVTVESKQLVAQPLALVHPPTGPSAPCSSPPELPSALLPNLLSSSAQLSVARDPFEMARKVKHTKSKSVAKDLLKLGALDGERAKAYVPSSISQNTLLVADVPQI